MRKPDEIALYALLREKHNHTHYQYGGEFAELTGHSLGIHPKRTWALLEKWAKKGWWSYGVSIRTGFFQPGAPDTLTP